MIEQHLIFKILFGRTDKKINRMPKKITIEVGSFSITDKSLKLIIRD